jgi:hypothetical protein
LFCLGDELSNGLPRPLLGVSFACELFLGGSRDFLGRPLEFFRFKAFLGLLGEVHSPSSPEELFKPSSFERLSAMTIFFIEIVLVLSVLLADFRGLPLVSCLRGELRNGWSLFSIGDFKLAFGVVHWSESASDISWIDSISSLAHSSNESPFCWHRIPP